MDESVLDLPALGDGTSGNNQPPHIAAIWENGVPWTDWPSLLGFPTPWNGDQDLHPDEGTNNISDETLSFTGHMTESGHLRQLSRSIPVSIPYKDPPSILERRHFDQPEFELTGDLALHILQSYLHSMTNWGSAPPFIHPRYESFKKPNLSHPGSLSAAIKLAKMSFLDRKTNRNLIWRLIRMEQERLLSNVRSQTLTITIGYQWLIGVVTKSMRYSINGNL